jgi:hypothetical protein
VTGDPTGINERIEAICDAGRDDLIGLIREFAALLDVYAPDIDPDRSYWQNPPDKGEIYRDDLGALVDLADYLPLGALATLAEVLAAEKTVRGQETDQ